jgi:beta-galactosidase
MQNNLVKVSITGAAKLLGLESGSTSSHESYQSPVRAAVHGRLLAYIQTSGKPGKVTVQLSSPGLITKTVVLTVK